jgi:dienelactone hydrolase
MLLIVKFFITKTKSMLQTINKLARRRVLFISFLAIIFLAPAAHGQTPWNLNQLLTAPTFKWLNQDTARVRMLVYTGLPFRNLKSTGIFAYYATPGSLSGNAKLDKNLPLIVLVHGGGGKAFKEWVTLWAKRGYAAIAMDLAGRDGDGNRLPDGGPDQTDVAKYLTIDSAMNTQWVYHAVANVILAHSLALSFKTIDPDKTAITGISWGGFLTCIVAGLDNRFKAAIPVYGCGYLNEPGAYFGKALSKLKGGGREKWMALYDPSNYIAKAKIPFLWVGGADDKFYQVTSVAKTYGLIKKQSAYRFLATMKHGHSEGWAPPEIGKFVDQYLLSGPPLPVINEIKINGTQITAGINPSAGVVSATFTSTSNDLNAVNKQWKITGAMVKGNRISVASPTVGTTLCFFNIKDADGNVISSEYIFP